MTKITFSVGKNWRKFAASISDQNVESAKADIVKWLGADVIRGKTVLDIGSGSGIHSYLFYRLGAKQVYSFDYDIESVNTTKLFLTRAQTPANWVVTQGSILDRSFLSALEPADIVYSWGVLHHTGNMWDAIRNSCELVKPGGRLFISIYAKGPKYPQHLAMKQKLNNLGNFGKWLMIWTYIFRRIIWRRIKTRQNPFIWNQKKARGMSVSYDVVDWLGGLPYEVAHEHEITEFLNRFGFRLVKKEERGEGACHRLLYQRTST